MRERHEVKVGDELIVGGQMFIVTGLRIELDEPPVLHVEPPIALLKEDG